MAILLCLTYTKEGRELLMHGLKSNKTSMKDFRHCMELLLSFFQWVHNGLCGHMNAGSTKLSVMACRFTSDVLDDAETICDFSLSKK